MGRSPGRAGREARRRSAAILNSVCGEDSSTHTDSYDPNVIGRLSEGALHAYLKSYYEPDEQFHEQKRLGFWADVAKGDKIIEIQTKAFGNLRRKLEAFLPNYDVTVVYPVAEIKRICWIDPATGEMSEPRRSPKKGRATDILPELYYLCEHLGHPRLTFRIVMLELTEYKVLCGWSADRKKGAWRVERLPSAVLGEYTVSNARDVATLIPPLPKEFTVSQLAKALGMVRGRRLSLVVSALRNMGVIEQVGRKGNAFLYSKKENDSV